MSAARNYLVLHKMVPGHILLRTSRCYRNEEIGSYNNGIYHTLHAAINLRARLTFTPDQLFSMLLMAKAQYEVRRSESLLPGVVEKLRRNVQNKEVYMIVLVLPAISPLTYLKEFYYSRPI
jgi:hypothetical protein